MRATGAPARYPLDLLFSRDASRLVPYMREAILMYERGDATVCLSL